MAALFMVPLSVLIRGAYHQLVISATGTGNEQTCRRLPGSVRGKMAAEMATITRPAGSHRGNGTCFSSTIEITPVLTLWR